MKRTVSLIIISLLCHISFGQRLNGKVDPKYPPFLYVDVEGNDVVKVSVSIDPKKELHFQAPIVEYVYKKETYEKAIKEGLSLVGEELKISNLSFRNGRFDVAPSPNDSVYVFYIIAGPSSKLNIYCNETERPFEMPGKIEAMRDYIINLNILNGISGGFCVGTEVGLNFPKSLPTPSLYVGYKWNNGLNLEGGFGLSLSKSDELYVYNSTGDKVEKHEYCKYHTFIRGGLDVFDYRYYKRKINKEWMKSICLMPQLGFAWDCIKGGDNSLNGYNTFAITLGARLGVKIPIKRNHLVLYATPEVATVWNEPKSNYETISANLKQFKQTSDSFDFRVQVGIQLCFGKSKK